MGGRGSSGGARSGGSWKLPVLSGSEKQIKWANEIIEETLGNIRLMSSAIDKHASYLNGLAANERLKLAEHNMGYTKDEVDSLQRYTQDGFSQMTKASQVIDMRQRLSSSSLQKMVEEIHHDSVKWDSKTKTWISQKRKK